MSALRTVGTRVAGAAVVVVVCGAAPLALASLAAVAWPRTWAWSAVGPARTGVLVADTLGWAAWALVVLGLTGDVLAAVRRGGEALPVGGARSRVAGWVAGLVLLLPPVAALAGPVPTGSAAVVAAATTPVSVLAAPAPVVETAAGAVAGAAQSPAVPVDMAYTVVPGDCLATIAQRYYGDEGAWSEIWQANMGKAMPGGLRFTDPNLIYAGWTLTLPGVAGPAEGASSAPAPALAPAPQPVPAASPLPAASSPSPEPAPAVPASPDAPLPAPQPAPAASPSPIPQPASASSSSPAVPLPAASSPAASSPSPQPAPASAPPVASTTPTRGPRGGAIGPGATPTPLRPGPRAGAGGAGGGPTRAAVARPTEVRGSHRLAAASSDAGAEHVHWVPEGMALGVSAVVAAALTRRIRRGRAKARAARGDGDVVVDPVPTDSQLACRVIRFEDAPVLDWLELANRHLTAALRAEGCDRPDGPDVPSVVLVRVGPDGVELFLDAPVDWAPGAFVLAEDGTSWWLPSDADQATLSMSACCELAWMPLLVPLGDGPYGTYLLHLEPGACVPVVGPGAAGMVRAWVTAAESWPWAEQVGVASGDDPVAAGQLASAFEGQDGVDARGTVLYVGDPAELSPAARRTCAVAGLGVGPATDPWGRRVAVAGDSAEVAPWGLELRPCQLDVDTIEAMGNVLDEQSLLPEPAPDRVASTGEPPPELPPAGAVEVRLLTFTPELVGLVKPLPTDKRVRITELVAWLALHGQRGSSSADILDYGIAGATAAKTVYNMISAARTALGDDADGVPRLQMDRSTGLYRVSPDVTVDVLRFEAMAAAGLAADDHEAGARCRAALALIDDVPVGNGSGRYGWWASTWEARVGRLAVKVARRLADLAQAGSVDLDVARWGIERARLAATDDEELVRVDMRLEAWAGGPEGRRAVDRTWAETARRAEDRDPGSGPSDATEAVYADIRRSWSGAAPGPTP